MMPSVKHADLEGASVLVTGGATGIGAALVEGFAMQGALVAFIDIEAKAGAELAARLQRAGRHPPALSRSRPARHRRASRGRGASRSGARTGHGARQQCRPRRPPRRRGSDAGILGRQPVRSTCRPQFFAIQAVAARHEGGAGAARSSISARSAYMIHGTGYPAYAAAKAGVVGLTSSLAGELGPWGIRVNAIAPGAVLTERQRRLWVIAPADFGIP